MACIILEYELIEFDTGKPTTGVVQVCASTGVGKNAIWSRQGAGPTMATLEATIPRTFASPCLHPSGQCVAYGSEELVVLWDAADDSRYFLRSHNTPVTALAFSEDGAHVASVGPFSAPPRTAGPFVAA